MFKKKTLIYLLIIAFTVLSLTAVTHVYSTYSGIRHYYGGDFTNYLVEKWKDRIDLTDIQVEQIKALIQNAKEQTQESRDNLKDQRKNIMELFFNENSTDEQIKAGISEVQSEASLMINTFADLAVDIRGVLTQQQLEKIKKYYAEKRSCRFTSKSSPYSEKE